MPRRGRAPLGRHWAGGESRIPASRAAIMFCTASTSEVGTVQLLQSALKTTSRPSTVVAYPDSYRALSTKPFFAWTLPSAGVPCIRLEIVPSTPAIGSAS